MDNKRVAYVDSAKIIGILLMIIGHCYWKDSISYLSRVIYSFHMPLFVIISGMFVKPCPFKEAIFKYSKAYLKPYMLICLLIAIIPLVAGIINSTTFDCLKDYVVRVLFASGSNKGDELWANMPIVCAFWFLVALFWGTSMTSWILNKFTAFEQILICVSLFSLSCYSIKYIRLPFSLQAGFCFPLYLIIGHYIRKYNILNQRYKVLTIVAMAITWIVAVRTFISISHCVYSGYFISLLGSISGSILFLIIIRKLNPSFLGGRTNTLSLLCGHQIVLMYSEYFPNPFILLSLNPILNLLIEIIIQVILAYFLAGCLSKTILRK